MTDRLSIGAGRSSFQKTYDGFVKYRILRQSSGARTMPVTLAAFASASLNSMKWTDQGIDDRKNYFSSRLSYTWMLLVARKFSSRFSLQLTPALVHRNLVPTAEDRNDLFTVGAGGRFKITSRMSVNAEYFYIPDGQIVSSEYDAPFSLGFDIETGGHVFQLHFSNAGAFFDPGYLTGTRGQWTNGDIYFGFNISRVFTLKKPEAFREQ
ncbi:MAG: hypothetical protein JW861_03720 [Bacteroidales bacterium]|nr:hypothetical protein [Bacteroidales bacterium]